MDLGQLERSPRIAVVHSNPSPDRPSKRLPACPYPGEKTYRESCTERGENVAPQAPPPSLEFQIFIRGAGRNCQIGPSFSPILEHAFVRSPALWAVPFQPPPLYLCNPTFPDPFPKLPWRLHLAFPASYLAPVPTEQSRRPCRAFPEPLVTVAPSSTPFV